MGKISPVSAKYIVHTAIQIDGVVDRPDVIGAVFGQTEGLLGADLELRDLQSSGRIGRIEVNTETRGGKTFGSIVVPSSLDKAETAIVAAALEVIQKIGPCNARIKVERIEDVRISKRKYIVERAEELLKNLVETVMPDSQELADEVASAVRVSEIQEYGRDRLPAGPAVDESEDIIVAEGRADVLNLLKHGFKNVIGINGTSVPETIVELGKKKVITAFLDGDRGGDLILKELMSVTEIDYVARAPDGKEVEELTKKEIHMALRARVAPEQARLERAERPAETLAHIAPMQPVQPVQHAVQEKAGEYEPRQIGQMANQGQQMRFGRRIFGRRFGPREGDYYERRDKKPVFAAKQLTPEQKNVFKEVSETLIGTRGAYLFDEKLNILGKVPVTELQATLKVMSNVYALVLDGVIDQELLDAAQSANVKCIVAMDSKVKPTETEMAIATLSEL